MGSSEFGRVENKFLVSFGRQAGSATADVRVTRPELGPGTGRSDVYRLGRIGALIASCLSLLHNRRIRDTNTHEHREKRYHIVPVEGARQLFWPLRRLRSEGVR